MARKVQKKKAGTAKAAQPKKSVKKKTAVTRPAAKKKARKASKPAAPKKKAMKASKPAAPNPKKAMKASKPAAPKKKASKKPPAAAKPAKKKAAIKKAKVSSAAKSKAPAAPKRRPVKTAPPARGKKRPTLPREIVARRKTRSLQAEALAARKKAAAALAVRLAAERQAAEKQVQNYEKGAGYFHKRKFSRAMQWFEKAAQGPDATLRHRAQIHARICAQRVNTKKPKLKTADDYYNYAIQLINDRELEEAESCLQKALRLSAAADHIHYAASVVRALGGDPEAAMQSLARAIELNGRNRLLARTDGDLSSLRDQPSWTELISSNAPRRPKH